MSTYKQKLPELLPDLIKNTNTKELMTGVGEYLDGIKSDINERKYLTDGTKLKEELLDIFATHFSLEFPKGLSENKKRIQLRDAIDAYRQTGTEDAMLRIFRLIGWDVIIDHVWTIYEEGDSVSTQWLSGNQVNYSTNTSYTYNSLPTLPITSGQFIFGNEVFDPSTGKYYVDLYDDFGNTYPKIPYYGETYPNGVTGRVIKTPYIRVRISESDYSDYVRDYIDPETGIKYTYSDTEQFKIISDAIEYFLNEGRPANVAILDILTFVKLNPEIVPIPNDNIVVTPEFAPKYNGRTIYNVGLDVGRYGDVYQIAKYSQGVGLDASPPDISITRTYSATSNGVMQYIQMRTTNTIVTVTSSDPNDVIEVQVSNTERIDLNTSVAFYTLQSLTGQVGTYPSISISGHTAVRLNFPNPLNGFVTVEIIESSWK